MASDKRSQATAAIMQRYNDVFQRHDPSELGALVAEDCIIENTVPAPDGRALFGRDACVAMERHRDRARHPLRHPKRRSRRWQRARSAGAIGGAKAKSSSVAAST